jgi:thiamine-phosphate pyrophosphorylase
LRRSGIKLGISTHDNDELERALSLMPDYVALGPVYPTILKKMKWHQQGLERVTEWKRRVGNVPLVGIGGMSVERAAGVFEAGADIVSVVTDITLNDAPEARLQQLLYLLLGTLGSHICRMHLYWLLAPAGLARLSSHIWQVQVLVPSK